MKTIEGNETAISLAQNWRADGKSQSWIAYKLAARGYRTRTGLRPSQSSVSLLLRNAAKATQPSYQYTTEAGDETGVAAESFPVDTAVDFLLNRYEVGEVLTSNLPKNIKMKLLVNIPIAA